MLKHFFYKELLILNLHISISRLLPGTLFVAPPTPYCTEPKLFLSALKYYTYKLSLILNKKQTLKYLLMIMVCTKIPVICKKATVHFELYVQGTQPNLYKNYRISLFTHILVKTIEIPIWYYITLKCLGDLTYISLKHTNWSQPEYTKLV